MSPSTHWFWILSRGAGITALLLASTSISYGLVMAGRMRRGGNADRRTYHEVLGLATMAAIAFHGLILLGDPFLHPDLADITVPFATSYRTVWTSLGIIAGWTTLAVGLSVYLRDRIGRRRAALIHRLTVVAWALGLVHALFDGNDAGEWWFLALVAVSIAPVVVLIGVRLAGGRLPARRGGGSARRAPAEVPAGVAAGPV